MDAVAVGLLIGITVIVVTSLVFVLRLFLRIIALQIQVEKLTTFIETQTAILSARLAGRLADLPPPPAPVPESKSSVSDLALAETKSEITK